MKHCGDNGTPLPKDLTSFITWEKGNQVIIGLTWCKNYTFLGGYLAVSFF